MKQVILTLDTETADLTGNVYDIAFAVHTKDGTILETYNALVDEVFTDAKKMMGAFYASKLFTHYSKMLADGRIGFAPWWAIVAEIQRAIDEHSVTTIAAYNLGFDRRVMRNTHRALGYDGAICPSGLQQLDIWQFACETKLSQATYKKLALDSGWVSSAGNIKTGAEYAYRFCSGDFGFIEDHTALSDALIEVEILAACFATKKKIPYNIVNASPWRIVNA
jgi:hypothetical protein